MYQITFKLLDKNDPLEIEEYEKALFRGFKNVADPSLETIWNIDQSRKRIKTRVSYSYQEIITARIDESIVAACAINFNMQIKLQLEELGFSIDNNENGICEGLLLFNNFSDLNNQLLLMTTFKKHMFDYIISKNIRKVYGTCNQKRISGYRLLGFQDIDQRIINNQKEYLLMKILE